MVKTVKLKSTASPIKKTAARASEIFQLPQPRIVPIRLSKLTSVAAYQRALRSARVDAMLTDEQWHEKFLACGGNKIKEQQFAEHLRNCIGIVTVTRNVNGTYSAADFPPTVRSSEEALEVLETLDGQYRLALLMLLFLDKMGFKDVEIWCDVIEPCPEEYASELFRIRNQTKSMSATERFITRVTAKQPAACRLLTLLTDNKIGVSGIAVKKSAVIYGRINCIAAFQSAFNLYGEKPIIHTIDTVISVWGRDSTGNVKCWSDFKAAMQIGCVSGLCLFFHRYPNCDKKKLVKKLSHLSPNDFARLCRGGRGWTRAVDAFKNIENIYLNRARRKSLVRA